MTSTEFKELLTQHQLTVNTFLDLRDIWDQLSAHDKYELLKEDLTTNTPILEAPTVEAISVEWMKSWAMKNWVKTKKCEYDIIISKMIDDWMEEINESNI